MIDMTDVQKAFNDVGYVGWPLTFLFDTDEGVAVLEEVHFDISNNAWNFFILAMKLLECKGEKPLVAESRFSFGIDTEQRYIEGIIKAHTTEVSRQIAQQMERHELNQQDTLQSGFDKTAYEIRHWLRDATAIVTNPQLIARYFRRIGYKDLDGAFEQDGIFIFTSILDEAAQFSRMKEHMIDVASYNYEGIPSELEFIIRRGSQEEILLAIETVGWSKPDLKALFDDISVKENDKR